MFGLLGFLGLGIGAYNVVKDSNINSSYVEMSKENAENNDRPYYYDTRGRIYYTPTGERVVEWRDFETHERVLKSVKTGRIVCNLTREENFNKTQESLRLARENNRPFYKKWGAKVNGGSYGVVWTVDGDEPYLVAIPHFYEALGINATCYYPAIIDKETTDYWNNGTTYYKVDRSREKEDLYVGMNGELKKFTWREWAKVIQNTTCVYVDSLNNWENNKPDFKDSYVDNLFLAYDKETDEPYAIEKNRLSRTGIGKMWRLYEDGNGGYVRDTTYYYLGIIHTTRKVICA